MSSAFFLKYHLGVELVIQNSENSLNESVCCKHTNSENFTASSDKPV